ncbi:MAG: hypothetical protein M3313_04030, partial [Actinomycetota bacterium]|nr:hypothetical protein [Actinomycetota bacterium]
MDDTFAEVIRLLRLAQTGEREQALILADEQLRAGETPGGLYARAISLHSIGDHDGAARTAERIIARTADAETSGWRSIALALRAWQHLLLVENDGQVFDLESILQDLAQAEARLTDGVFDGFVLSTAHTCLGNGYHELRLYELARPNFEAAFAAATARPDEIIVDRAVASQLNLATMHLNWSMELHRIRDSAGSREKSVIAARHAALAQEYARTDDMQSYADHAGLLLACANSSLGDEAREVDRIRDALKALEGRGLRETRGYALPFLARALGRVGQHSEALEVAMQAICALPEDATWIVA